MLAHMTDDYLTSAELATELGVSPRTVTRYVGRGLLSADKVVPGRRGIYLFSKSDPQVRDLIAEHRRQQAPIEARALREAAEAWLLADMDAMPDTVSMWLKERADVIEEGNLTSATD